MVRLIHKLLGIPEENRREKELEAEIVWLRAQLHTSQDREQQLVNKVLLMAGLHALQSPSSAEEIAEEVSRGVDPSASPLLSNLRQMSPRATPAKLASRRQAAVASHHERWMRIDENADADADAG